MKKFIVYLVPKYDTDPHRTFHESVITEATDKEAARRHCEDVYGLKYWVTHVEEEK